MAEEWKQGGREGGGKGDDVEREVTREREWKGRVQAVHMHNLSTFTPSSWIISSMSA